MELIESKVIEGTTYKVSGNTLIIKKDGEEMRITFANLETMANRFHEGIRDEVFEIYRQARTKACLYCGKPFLAEMTHRKYCSDKCCYEQQNATARSRREEIREMRKARESKRKKKHVSKLTEKEREMRKIGLHYADIQKKETLAMVGRIQIPYENAGV